MANSTEYLQKKAKENGGLVQIQIVFVDIVGYSKRSSWQCLQLLNRFNNALDAALKHIARIYFEVSEEQGVPFGNNIIKIPLGDGILVAFPFNNTTMMHVEFCEYLIQYLSKENTSLRLAATDKENCNDLEVRCGVGSGDVNLFTDINGCINIAGKEVNITSRVMGCANPQSIAMSEGCFKHIEDKIDLTTSPENIQEIFPYSEEHEIKHKEKIRVYHHKSSKINTIDPGKSEVSKSKNNTKKDLEKENIKLIQINCVIDKFISEMKPIPPGKFLMGRDGDFESVLNKEILMSSYAITQELFEHIMGHNPSRHISSNGPVEMVSWFVAAEFCNALSEKFGLDPAYSMIGEYPSSDRTKSGFRLPTEAEWEFCATEGGQSPVYGPLSEVAICAADKVSHPLAVGTKAANTLGLYDMLGNVWEWCDDWFALEFPSEAVEDYSGPSSGIEKVLKGCAFDSFPSTIAGTFRYRAVVNMRHPSYGFRVVRNAEARV